MTEPLPLSGFVAPGFEPVRDQLLAHFAQGEELGCQLAVTLDGEVVVDLSAGHADRDKSRAVARDSLFPVFSCTKPVAALVIAWLADRGALAYDEPVASLWPEFAAAGKAGVTIAQALSHQAGLSGIPSAWSAEDWYDAERTAARVAAMTPLWPPGTATGYHPITWGVIAGEIARRADGRSLGTILRAEIADPLGIDFWIGLPEADEPRAVDILRPRRLPEFGEINAPTRAAFLERWSSPSAASPRRFRASEFPAASGIGTASALARLAQAYARSGTIEETPIISAGAIAEATKERASGPDLVLPADVSFGVGLFRNRPGRTIFGPGSRTVGHSGHGGACVMADPERRLTLGYVTNKQSNALVIDPRAERLIAAAYSSAQA
jgi:CubicO group peptidase (beta-lactamase class C family)